MRYCEVGWWTRRSRQAGVPRTAWYMYHRPRKTPKLGENLENFVENSTNIYRERSGPPDPTRPRRPTRRASDTRRGVHEHDAARAGRPARPAGAPVARDPPARGAPTPHPHPRTRHPRHTTPGPVTSPHTRPPTAARPRATRVPVRRRPHAHPPRTAIAIRARPPTHGHAGWNRLRSVPSAAVAPARGRAARRAGGAGRVRVSRSRADCAPRRARRAPAPSAPRRVCSAAPVRSPRRAGGHLRHTTAIRRRSASDAIRQTITHLTRSRPHGTHPAPGTAEARAPAAAHVTVAAPVAENGASPLVAPLSSPPVSRVSIYSCTAVSVTLNHTRHLLLSARLSLAARLCVRASQAGRWSRVAAVGWLEVEVAISPVHL